MVNNCAGGFVSCASDSSDELRTQQISVSSPLTHERVLLSLCLLHAEMSKFVAMATKVERLWILQYYLRMA